MVVVLMMSVLTFMTMVMILIMILMMVLTMVLLMILMMILMMVGAGTCILSKLSGLEVFLAGNIGMTPRKIAGGP